jgi:putative inorganic carbon (HCO3(-)) transporter
MRPAAYTLMAVSLAAATFLKGGVIASQWTWTALGLSLAACLSLWCGTEWSRVPRPTWGMAVLALLLGWMLLQFLPLPPALVVFLSPYRWNAVQAAREATGQDLHAWVALSVAPPATLERLLYVVPAMAAFVASREVVWWWAGRTWVAVAPVVVVAWLESLLGLVQFALARMAGGPAVSVSGTYVNYDHFAGLLGMAFPLAVMGAVSAWRKGTTRQNQPAGAALRTSAMAAVAACLLMGVFLSLSRMGVVSTLAGATLMGLAALPSRRTGEGNRRRWWLWLLPVAIPLGLLVFLPTRDLVLRFAELTATPEVSKDTRVQIWSDTLGVVAAYPWTGCGLGAYEHGLYRFKTVAPTNTVDFAHNDYLQILAELGLPGMLLVAVLGGWILKRTLTLVVSTRGGANWELAVGLLGALLTFGLHSLAEFNLFIPANTLALAWLCGVATSLEPKSI